MKKPTDESLELTTGLAIELCGDPLEHDVLAVAGSYALEFDELRRADGRRDAMRLQEAESKAMEASAPIERLLYLERMLLNELADHLKEGHMDALPDAITNRDVARFLFKNSEKVVRAIADAFPGALRRLDER